jgi:hypothetical protein
MDSTVGFACSAGTGTVLVQTISTTSGCAPMRSSAPAANSPWVQATPDGAGAGVPQPVDQRVPVVHRHTEEPVHLWGVQRHGQHPARPGVDHQQKLDQVLLHRGHRGLHQEHVALPAVGLQLHLEAVVGEARHPDRVQCHAQLGAHLRRELGVDAAGEDGDLTHVGPSSGQRRSGCRRR